MENFTQTKLKQAFQSNLKARTSESSDVKQIDKRTSVQAIVAKNLFMSEHKPKFTPKENHSTFKVRSRRYQKNAHRGMKIDIMALAKKRHKNKLKRNEPHETQHVKFKNHFSESYKKAAQERGRIKITKHSQNTTYYVSLDGGQNYRLLKEAPMRNVALEKTKNFFSWADNYVNGHTVRKVEYMSTGFHFSWDIRKMGDFYRPSFLVGYKQTGHLFQKNLKRYTVKQYEKMMIPPKNLKEQLARHAGAGMRKGNQIVFGTIKGGIKASANTVLEKGISSYKDELRQGSGIAGSSTAEILSIPEHLKTAKKASGIVRDGTGFAVRTTWNTVKNAGITAYNIGSLALDGAQALYRNRKNLPEYAKRKFKNGVKNASNSVKAKITNTANNIMKEGGKKLLELLKLLLAKLLELGLTGLVILLLLIAIPAVIIIVIYIFTSTILAPIQDGNSIMATHQYCMELTKEWEKEIDKIKKKYEEYNECNYGKNDKCTIKLQCQDNLEINAKVLPSSLELYALAVIEFEYDVQNMGVELGNTFKATSPWAATIKKFIKDAFFFMNPTDESKMLVEQEILKCKVTETEGSGEDAVTKLHEHEYTLTEITIELKTVTDLLVHLGWDNDKINEYNDILNELILESFDLSSGENNSWKDEIHLGSDYDYMDKDIFIEFWDKDVPVLNITRAEFVEMVSSYCIPTGKIGYKFGSKNPASGKLDCSGYTSYMFDLCGINIKQGTAAQWSNSVGTTAVYAKLGDLVFKQPPSSNGINHVGIYLGNGKFAHCASSTGTVINSYKGFIYYRRPLVKFKDDVKQPSQ